MRVRSTLFVVALVAVCLPASGDEIHLDAILSLRGAAADGDPSWLQGGWGKMYFGGELGEKPGTGKYHLRIGAEETELAAAGSMQFGVDWRPLQRFGVVVNGVARLEPSEYEGDAIGLSEAFAEGILFFRQADRLRLRGGMFFLPTSQENVGPMWSSPYTISFSAINSWIGEEVRPVGLDADYRIEGPTRVSVGATAFVGNDTMGTLPAWRGWAMHDRLSVYGETLPLAHLWSLEQVFVFQKDGTTPITNDFDDRIGWSARIRIERPNVASVQLTHVDNRGDRARYGDEYSWGTDFNLLGAHWTPTDRLYLAAEYLDGYTEMGLFVPVEAEFRSAYLLGSWSGDRWRASLRSDWFDTTDEDGDPRGETNEEEGWGWTAAFFWSLTPSLRIGLEVLDVDAENVMARQTGYDFQVGGTSATLEVRWNLGRSLRY
ncbi:MAG: hypothetical protein ACRD2J_07430 [Thermoanaerobaculia bacterium]